MKIVNEHQNCFRQNEWKEISFRNANWNSNKNSQLLLMTETLRNHTAVMGNIQSDIIEYITHIYQHSVWKINTEGNLKWINMCVLYNLQDLKKKKKKSVIKDFCKCLYIWRCKKIIESLKDFNFFFNIDQWTIKIRSMAYYLYFIAWFNAIDQLYLTYVFTIWSTNLIAKTQCWPMNHDSEVNIKEICKP